MFFCFAREPDHVWETAVWLNVANLKLVQRPDGHYRIVPAATVGSGARILPNDLLPILLQVRDDGRASFQLVPRASSLRIYYRPDPAANEQGFREALPELYKSFRAP